jgi:hypothetical protein
VDQITHENHENWNPTNNSDFTVYNTAQILTADEIDDNDFEKDFEEHLAS